MSEVTNADFFKLGTCLLLALFLPALVLGAALSAVWRRSVGPRPITGGARRLRLLAWLLAVAGVSVGTAVWLAVVLGLYVMALF